jgi:hypothetical protein
MKSSAIMIAVLAAAAPAAADVVVKSATDTSRCTPTESAQNTATLRDSLDDVIASQLSTGNAHIDASIVSLTVEKTRVRVVVSAQVRIAISDDNGRILSVLAGGAKVEQSAGTIRARDVRVMREDAVRAAVDGMTDKMKVSVATTAWPRRVGKLVGFVRPRS